MATAERLYTDADVQIAAHRNLLIVAFSDVPSAEHLRECGRAARGLARKHPGGIGLLDLVLSGTPKFSNETREEAVKLSRDPALFRLGVADVVLIEGLVGVAGLAKPVGARIDWASLIRRVYLEDVIACPCGGRRRVVADITDRSVVVAILEHLGLPAEPPPIARARSPSSLAA